METRSTRPVIHSLINGILLPLPGRNSIRRQIQLEMENIASPRLTGFFAIGHMMIAYPVIVSLGLALCLTMEIIGR
jgi:hypothetical protein